MCDRRNADLIALKFQNAKDSLCFAIKPRVRTTSDRMVGQRVYVVSLVCWCFVLVRKYYTLKLPLVCIWCVVWSLLCGRTYVYVLFRSDGKTENSRKEI